MAFLDIALGITSPLAGALAGIWGVDSVYLVGAIAAGLSIIVALRLLRGDKRRHRHSTH